MLCNFLTFLTFGCRGVEPSLGFLKSATGEKVCWSPRNVLEKTTEENINKLKHSQQKQQQKAERVRGNNKTALFETSNKINKHAGETFNEKLMTAAEDQHFGRSFKHVCSCLVTFKESSIGLNPDLVMSSGGKKHYY